MATFIFGTYLCGGTRLQMLITEYVSSNFSAGVLCNGIVLYLSNENVATLKKFVFTFNI